MSVCGVCVCLYVCVVYVCVVYVCVCVCGIRVCRARCVCVCVCICHVCMPLPCSLYTELPLLKPTHSLIAVQNQFAVCDYGNHRIQVFDGDGQFVRSFGGYGDAPGRVAYPLSVTITKTGQYAYVAYTYLHTHTNTHTNTQTRKPTMSSRDLAEACGAHRQGRPPPLPKSPGAGRLSHLCGRLHDRAGLHQRAAPLDHVL